MFSKMFLLLVFCPFISPFKFEIIIPTDVQHNPDPHCRTIWPDCTDTRNNFLNTICVYPHCGPRSSNCKELPADAKFRGVMLKVHNKLRNKIASGKDYLRGFVSAANMRALSYDLALEHSATCHVNGCSLQYDKCRRTFNFSTVVQNVARNFNILQTGGVLASENSDELLDYEIFAKVVENNWYEDNIASTNISQVINEYYKINETNPLATLIWAGVTHIGCARAFQELNMSVLVSYLTCNYGLPQNFENEVIYRKGQPCSECPIGLECNDQYSALCGEIDDIAVLSNVNPFSRSSQELEVYFERSSMCRNSNGIGYWIVIVLSSTIGFAEIIVFEYKN